MKNVKIISILLLLTPGCSDKLPETTLKTNYPLENEIKTLSRDIAEYFEEPVLESWDSFIKILDSLSTEVESEIKNAEPPEKIKIIRAIVFDRLKIRFDKNENLISNCLPQLVYKTKTGSCLGTGLLLLLLGERLKLPLYGVLVPTHFFVKYDCGNYHINIEPIKSGKSFEDSWYIKKYNFNNRKHEHLNNLTAKQVLAVTHYSAGNILLSKKNFDQAIKQYGIALNLWPHFTEASVNLAVALDQTGKSDEALKVICNIKKIPHNSSDLNKRKGILLLKNKLYKKAVKEYTGLLETNPDDPEIMYGLGVSYFYLEQYSKAEKYLEIAIKIKPDFKRAKELISLINKTQ